MSMISEQVADLREKAQIFEDSGCATNGIVKTFRKAADTIEELSAKLATANMERSTAYYNDGWIPCSSGVLPTEKGYYWVTEGWGEGKVGFIHYSPKYNGTFEALMKIYDLEITAWMPANLPEPYKGVE